MMDIGPIETGEVKDLRFDFSLEAGEGSVLNAPAVSVTLQSGTDPMPTAVLVGTPSVSGTFVVQRVQPGVVGCVYKIRALVSDGSGQRHGMSAKLAVVNG